jgi:metal-responsive CopG/Arc/MetJ family transcriptional regulator
VPHNLSQQEYKNLGVWAPSDFIKEIDAVKGKYYSRNKFVLKILEENLYRYREENNNKNASLQAVFVGREGRQAAEDLTANSGVTRIDSRST